MKPAAFEYIRATSVEDAVAALSASGGTAKILAGGQSLVPMLNFRLVDAPTFIDINAIENLSDIEETQNNGLRIGATTRHHAVEMSEAVEARFPVIHAAMKHVAHLAIRNRGTIGGSLSHADPAAEWPALALLLDATVITASSSGERAIPASEFFLAPLTTALTDDEMVIAVDLPGLPDGCGWGFEEMAQRHGDFAIAGAAAVVAIADGEISQARVAVFGADETPVRATAAEKALIGQTPTAATIAEAARTACAELNPMTDLHGSADYRRHLAGVLVRRVVETAVARAA